MELESDGDQEELLGCSEEESSDDNPTPPQDVSDLQTSSTPLYKIFRFFQQLLSELKVTARYVISDSSKNKKNFVLAVLTVVITVSSIAAISTTISKSSLVFLKLAEKTVGEYDLVYSPLPSPTVMQHESSILHSTSGTKGLEGYLLNSTDMSIRLKEKIEGEVAGVAPRWVLTAKILNPLHPRKNFSVTVLVFDTLLEKDMGLGRAWKKRALGFRETIVSGPVLRFLDLEAGVGQWATLDFDVQRSLKGVGVDVDVKSVVEDYFVKAMELFFRENNEILTEPTLIDAFVEAIMDQVGIDLPEEIKNLIVEQIESYLEQGMEANEVVFEAIFEVLYSLMPNPDFSFQSDVIIHDKVENTNGKWPVALGNVVILEAKYLVPMLLTDALPSFISSNVKFVNYLLSQIPGYTPKKVTSSSTVYKMLLDFPIHEYAPIVVVQNKNRLDTYLSTSDERREKMKKWENKVAFSLGIDLAASCTAPIDDFLLDIEIGRAFLSQVLLTMVIVLFLLSMLVIYSLLLSNTEEKTYEYGMLRALGLKHKSLIALMSIQAFFYSLPGVLIGLSLGFIIYLPVAWYLADFSDTEINPYLQTRSIVLGILLGTIMPVVANIVPIRQALSRTLRDALDLYHQSFSETIIKIERLENLGVSLNQTVFAILLTIFGFTFIYVVPYLFLFQHYEIFIFLLNVTLLGMVFGLGMISAVIQDKFEKLIVGCISIIPKWRKFTPLVRKSLSGHKDRNRKTAVMFTTVVAFVIFSAALFDMQVQGIEDTIKIVSGADLVLQTFYFDQPLPYDQIKAFFDKLFSYKDQSRNPVVSYSFATYPLSSMPGIRDGADLSNMIGSPSPNIRLTGLDKNYMETIYDKYVITSEIDDHFHYQETTDHHKPDFIQSLYTDAGQAEVPIENKYPIPKSMATGDTALINTNVTNITTNYYPTLFDYRTSFTPKYYTNDLNRTYSTYLDIVPTTAMHGLATYIDDPMQIINNIRILKKMTSNFIYLAKPRAFVSLFPGFPLVSPLTLLMRALQPTFVSMTQYKSLAQDAYDARVALVKEYNLDVSDKDAELFEEPVVRMSKLLIKLKEGADRSDREFVLSSIRNFIEFDDIIISDTVNLMDQTSYASLILNLFFYTVTSIAMVLCFFVLWISFTANVRENSWEFGVLRAVGLKYSEVVMIYILEALTIIFTSIILATAIGLMVAWTLALQNSLFNRRDPYVNFPYYMFLFVLVLSTFVSVLGSYLPAASFGRRPIALVIRAK